MRDLDCHGVPEGRAGGEVVGGSDGLVNGIEPLIPRAYLHIVMIDAKG
jgi:hypothetical protein